MNNYQIIRTTDSGDETSKVDGGRFVALRLAAEEILAWANATTPRLVRTIEQSMEKHLYQDVLDFWNGMVEEEGHLPSFVVVPIRQFGGASA